MRILNKVKIAWLLFTIILPFPVAFPQETLNDTIELDEVVVTATKTRRNLKDVPARISVIRSRTIELTPAMQVDDILRFTPGINVNRTSGIYSQRPMVTLRGLSGNEQSRTLVLMNGVPINTSDEGGVNWNRINPHDIERIEIFRGPGSSLYGNNAMGGVINLITKKSTKPHEVFGSVSYGTFNTVRQDLIIMIRNKKGYYGTVSEYYLKSDGYIAVSEENRTSYDVALALEEIGLSARAGNDRNQWLNWELQFDVFRDERGEGSQIYSPKGCYRNFNTNLFRGTLKGGDERTQYELNLFYQLEHYFDVNERMRNGNFSRYDVNAYRKDMGALFNLTRELIKNNTLTAGLEIKQGSIKGGDYYQTPRQVNDSIQVYDTISNAGIIRTLAGYLQDEHAFLDNKIRLIVSLRFDRVNFSDGEYYSTDPWNTTPELKDHTWSELSPRIGLRFNFIPEFSSYITYSHGFRASILDDLTRSGWMWVGPKYANPELGPESIDNYEIGVDVFPVNNMKVTASAYYARGTDFLYYVSTGDSLYGRPIYIRENVTNVSLKGFETDFLYKIKNITVLASYAYTDSKIDAFAERPELENKVLAYVPKHTASASLFWQNKIVNTSLRCLYKGEQFSDDANTNKLNSYVTFDIQLSRKIIENLIIALDIQDIFDNEHMISNESISPGRIITGRLVIKF